MIGAAERELHSSTQKRRANRPQSRECCNWYGLSDMPTGGGWRCRGTILLQRVALARSIVYRPQLLCSTNPVQPRRQTYVCGLRDDLRVIPKADRHDAL